MSLELLIKKATSETLTADNWQYILDVCDEITTKPEENTRNAIKIVEKRLSTRDANVILRILSLVVAMAENCGSRMKQEIASKSFLDGLLRKLADRKLHKLVKVKVAEVIGQLHQSFQADPLLKPMLDAYATVQSQYRQYLNEAAPSKPAKTKMTKQDKQKEDAELEKALQLSLQEYEAQQTIKKAYLLKPLPETKEDLPPQPEPRALHTGGVSSQPTGPSVGVKAKDTIALVLKVRALYDLISYEPDELSFRKGDVINVIESVYRDWWRGSLPNGKVGIFPLNYVTPVVVKSPEELGRELAVENQILTQDSKAVDKLLALLSQNPESVDEDEVTRLYNQVIPLRPTLAKAIDKYSLRKDELVTLHKNLNSEVKLYNELVDNQINRRHSNPGALPYPAQGNFDFLQQQPTSSGFGNSQYQGNSAYTGQTGQATGQATGQHQAYQTGQQIGQATGQQQAYQTGQQTGQRTRQPEYQQNQPTGPQQSAPQSTGQSGLSAPGEHLPPAGTFSSYQPTGGPAAQGPYNYSQPTGVGFGNAPPPAPPTLFPSGYASEFSNVRRFPDVDPRG